jgi:hypothetical protein
LDFADIAFASLYRYKNRAAPSAAPGSFIEVTHTTDRFLKTIYYTSILLDPKRYGMGAYTVTYQDGTTASLPVVYGENISNDSLSWVDPDGNDIQSWLDRTQNDKLRFVSPSIRGVASATKPVRDGRETWYTTLYRNPHPDKKAVSLAYTPPPEYNWTVRTRHWEVL